MQVVRAKVAFDQQASIGKLSGCPESSSPCKQASSRAPRKWEAAAPVCVHDLIPTLWRWDVHVG